MPVLRLQHAALPMSAGGGEAAVGFYERALGLTGARPPEGLGVEGLLWFDVGDSGDEVHLFTDAGGPRTARQHICLQVDDLEPVREALKTNGYVVEEADPIPGRARFFTTDPFGNRIEIATFVSAGR